MHTKDALIKDIKASGLNPKGTVLIHSSMKAIGQVEGGADTVLDALADYMSEGLLLFPAHSWHENNLKDNIYDVRTEPSCVGLLTNLFKDRPGVVRSMHPSHSVAALGTRAAEYVDKDRQIIENQGFITPCPRYGCFGSLYDEKAQLLFLGAPLTTNTFIHSIEEWLEIPDRLKATPRQITLVDGQGNQSFVALTGHYNSYGDVSKNYDKMEGPLLDRGIAKLCQIGDAKCYLIDVVAMADLIVSYLKIDPDLFVDKRKCPK